jgi:hypothetical protein
MPNASEFPIQGDDPLVIESVTWLDGTPVQQASERHTARWVASWRERLSRPGIVALAGGLAMLWCFLLPWFVAPAGAFADGPSPGPLAQGPGPLPPITHPGWSIASGLNLGSGPTGVVRVALFIHLWLIPLVAAALLVVAWLAAQRRISSRHAAGTILALSALSLLVELGYVVQVTSLEPVFPNGVGVAWGCWIAIIASVATGAAAANLLRSASSLAEVADTAHGA